MMCIVEDQREPTALPPGTTDPCDKTWISPFMDDHNIGVGKLRLMVESVVIGDRRQVREVAGEAVDGTGIRLDEIRATPPVLGLQGNCFMPAFYQFSHDPAQEMGVAMVPVGYERV